MKKDSQYNRRNLIKGSMLIGGTAVFGKSALMAKPSTTASNRAPAFIRSDSQRLQIPLGIQMGDVTQDSVTFWSKTDRPAQMVMELADNEGFVRSLSLPGPSTLDVNDFTAKMTIDLSRFQSEQIHYRVSFKDLNLHNTLSEPYQGQFLNPRRKDLNPRFFWSGDTAGQGWGINPDFGGMPIYKAMLDRQPDFFIHCGDTIYADGPMMSEVTLDDGRVWRNVLIEEKTKVAESLAEFRANYAYNMLDPSVRAFNSCVPQLVQWDDHETVNNW